MDVQGFLDSLRNDPDYADQIVHVHTEPARKPGYAPLPDGLLPGVAQFVDALGIEKFYRHQAEAIDAALQGKDVLLATGTSSGKSLCYQLPILQELLKDPDATALLIFPMKALARDQATAWNRGIQAITTVDDISSFYAMPFDGDSGRSDRRKARDNARVLISNPEMIHTNMLPGHARWQRFLRGLKYVVIDEVHTYTGFFGANMANVLRRLDRIAKHYGDGPQFICCSATVGNPSEVAELLTSRPVHVVDSDSSASGNRTFVFWNPPKIKKREWRGRRSANVEAHELMTKLIRQRVTTICFSKSRNSAEMVYRYVREALKKESPGLTDRVIPYRGGYAAAERRQMEQDLRDGKLLGVSATRALELGIDIGMLEACIIIGYPGILNAFLQQAGRAGRGSEDSLCILVGIGTPINQYIMNHPEYVFGKPVERVVIDRDNPFVVIGHVRCATAELPVTGPDVERFGYAAPLCLDVLEENRKVHHANDAWYHAANEQPAFEVRLRGYGDSDTVVMNADTGKVMDRLDTFRAMRLFYDDAIYFHRGDTYGLVEHDTERHIVMLRKVDVSYYTDPVTGTAVDHIDNIMEQRPVGTGTGFVGEIFAILDTPIYERVKFYTLDRISQHPTGLPQMSYEAMAFWFQPPPELADQVRDVDLDPASGMQAILFCVSRILPLFLTCDQNDFDWTLGCTNSSWDTLFWFEFYMHGVGNSEQCYDRMEEIFATALEHLLTCDCEDGCPNCSSRLITPYHVRNIELGEGNGPFSRRAGVVILNCVLNGDSVKKSLALVNEPREKRGQEFLPSVVDRPRLTEPNQMPLNDRMRNLLTRKLERERFARTQVGHSIDMKPPVGPPQESAATLPESDQERRSGQKAIRHKGTDLSKRLRKKLTEPRSCGPGSRGRSPSKSEDEVMPGDGGRAASNESPITAGDSVARRARLRRKK